MSGHSKWSTIKRKKGAIDAKRGKVFSKLAREVTVAARSGGSGDINFNAKLRLVVTKAREVNMPAENIKKAILRGTGELDGINYEEVMYEGYGIGGVAVVIETLTDNRNRTTGEIRAIFTKYNGALAQTGAVTWNFKRQGVIVVTKTDEEKIVDVAINAGAEDFETTADDVIINTDFETFDKVRKAIEDAGFTIKDSDVSMMPGSYMEVDVATAEKNLKLIEALDDLDDVNKVTTNMDIPEAMMQKLASGPAGLG